MEMMRQRIDKVELKPGWAKETVKEALEKTFAPPRVLKPSSAPLSHPTLDERRARCKVRFIPTWT